MSSTALPRAKDEMMNDQTKLGLYLLFPPTVLWGLIILFLVDSTLANYVFSRMNLVVMDIIFLIAGFIFPGAALAVGVNGWRQKLDTSVNLSVMLISLVMLVLMAVNIFGY